MPRTNGITDEVLDRWISRLNSAFRSRVGDVFNSEHLTNDGVVLYVTERKLANLLIISVLRSRKCNASNYQLCTRISN
jgi:hypothetical protein